MDAAKRLDQQDSPIIEALIFLVIGFGIFEEDRIYALALLSDLGLRRQVSPEPPSFTVPEIDQRLVEKGLEVSAIISPILPASSS